MYYNITAGDIRIQEIKDLDKYQIEDHSYKQKSEDSKYFDVYKVFEDKNFIWLRVNKSSQTIKSFQRPDTVNEYQFIIDFLEINPELRIEDESGETMHIDTVKQLLPLRDKILKQK